MPETIEQKIEALREELTTERALIYTLEKEITAKKRLLREAKDNVDEMYNKIKMLREMI